MYKFRLIFWHISHRLTDDVPDGVCRIPLHLRRGVGVGAEGKACRVVAQGTGQRFDVYAILQGKRCECVSEVVESDMLGADGFQDFVMRVAEGIRVEHGARLG